MFKKEIMENMKHIEGNFRQEEIKKQWINYDKKVKYGLVHLKHMYQQVIILDN